MRREKYIPNGGPDGGDGGRGGHIILRGNRNYWTLLHLRYDRHALAGHGESGSKNRSFGKDGEDKIIEVIRKEFRLTPKGIIETLNLRRPIYQQTAAYGHFGRTDIELPWEQLNKVEELKAYFA